MKVLKNAKEQLQIDRMAEKGVFSSLVHASHAYKNEKQASLKVNNVDVFFKIFFIKNVYIKHNIF
jgi:hypothetical protein